MISGSTLAVSKIVTRVNNFTITSPTGTLVTPDGNTSALAVNVDSQSQSVLHIASANLPLTALGDYMFRWSLPLSSGEVLIYVDQYFATFLDVNQAVRDALQLDVTIIGDVVIERGIAATAKILQDRYIEYVQYSSMSAADKIAFDMAVGLITSAYLRPGLPKTTPVGDMLSNKIGPDQYNYADINAHSQNPMDPIEKQWLCEAQEILDTLSFLKSDIEAANNTTLFVATGSRRLARTALSLPDSSTPDYDIWGDAQTRYQWSRLLRGYW